MRRRLPLLLLCAAVLALTFPALTGRVSAAEYIGTAGRGGTGGEVRAVTEETGRPAARTTRRTPGADASGNDALFFGYLKQLGGTETAVSGDTVTYASSTAGNHLRDFDRKLYDRLKEEIRKVAAGERESTVFRFTMEELGLSGQTWTPSELGIEVSRDNSGQLTDATWDALWSPLYRAIGHDRDRSSASIMDKLLVDCPFELYWFDKSHEDGNSAAAHWTYHWSVNYSQDRGFGFTDDAYLSVEMTVAANYAKNADATHYYSYQTDTALARQAAASAAGAKNIVDANTGRSDFEKLTAYKNTICELVSYDYNAAKAGTSAYGNGPWQLIRVFDGDLSTNVVCEGYAKAFQYLCELSDFSGDTTSYIITGNLVDQRGTATPHMWNHVRLNGQYWLVDLTNCDVENAPPDWLFLKAPSAQSGTAASRSYMFSRNDRSALRYTDLENAYEDDAILLLAETDYVSTGASGAVGGTPDSGAGNTGGADSSAPAEETPPSGNVNWSVAYPVTVTGGTASVTEAPAGLAVTVTADPAPTGTKFLAWGGAAGLSFTSGSSSSPTATFLMPESALYLAALYDDLRFSDVPEGTYYYEPVSWAVAEGITTGTTETTFNPHDTCTRAQILTFLWRASGQPEPQIGNPFSDVSRDDYFYRAALWAYEHDLVAGTVFDGYAPCTRAAVMEFLWILAGSPTGSPNPFADVPAEAAYAEAVAWAVSRGITTGTSETTFEPVATCTRAQIVTFLFRHLKELGGTLTAPETPDVPEAPETPEIEETAETPEAEPAEETPEAAEEPEGEA